MKNEREKLFLSEKVIQQLFTKQILTRNYEEPGTYSIDGDRLIVCKSTLDDLFITPVVKAKDHIREWIEEWRALFPKGKNPNTDKLFKGDKPMCLKNMTKFMKDYDYTKEEIMEVTQKAIEKARDENWMFFPMAHYFIHKKDTGSRLAELLEFKREGGEDEGRGIRRTGI